LALAGDKIVNKGLIADAALPVWRADRQFFLDAKAGNAGELDQIAAVATLGKLSEAADAAEPKQIRLVRVGPRVRLIGLDHADDAMAGTQRILGHRQVTRLENIEGHLPPGQQQRTRQRKHWNDFRQRLRPFVDGVHRHVALRPATAPKLTASTIKLATSSP